MRLALVVAALACALPAAAQTINGTFKVVCVADRRATEIRNQRACVQGTPRLSFGDEVTLAVEHAPEVSFDDVNEPNPADLVLFLEGRALPGTRASVGLSQLDQDEVTTTLLTYRLTRDLTKQLGRQNWKEILVAANTGAALSVSTGLENGAPSYSRATVELQALRPERLLFWFVAAVLGLGVFVAVAARTGTLRDKEPAGTAVNSPTERAFSLSRVQMAAWTMLVVYAYLFIWFLTGEYIATIPVSIVGLLGISLATFGTAAAIDASKAQTNKEKLRTLERKLADGSREPGLEKEKQELEPRSVVCKSEGFVKDVATSADGASLHRLQFIVWSLALAGVFLVTVWKTLAMPDFDATLLGLMGITSGTFVGMKLPENKC